MTIWVVRHGDDLYIRSYRGPAAPGSAAPGSAATAASRPAGWTKRLCSRTPTIGLDDQIDAAYRAKYRRYRGTYVDPMLSPQARGTTMKLVPPTTGTWSAASASGSCPPIQIPERGTIR